MTKLLSALLIAAPLVVQAQPELKSRAETSLRPIEITAICGDTTEILNALMKYEEEMVWSGREDKGVLATIWENKKTKSFTIVKTVPTGEASCIVSYGKPVKLEEPEKTL